MRSILVNILVLLFWMNNKLCKFQLWEVSSLSFCLTICLNQTILLVITGRLQQWRYRGTTDRHEHHLPAIILHKSCTPVLYSSLFSCCISSADSCVAAGNSSSLCDITHARDVDVRPAMRTTLVVTPLSFSLRSGLLVLSRFVGKRHKALIV